MKKGKLLNGPVSRIIAMLGHGDSICICDAGLPIPQGVERIDLALSQGIPPFLTTVEAVVSELCVERAMVATEFTRGTGREYSALLNQLSSLGSAQINEVAVEDCSHEQFKKLTQECRAIIRTGECTPYANVILYAGVTF